MMLSVRSDAAPSCAVKKGWTVRFSLPPQAEMAEEGGEGGFFAEWRHGHRNELNGDDG